MFTYPEAGWLLKAGMTTGFGSDRLRVGAIKLFCDGGMSSRTAAVDEPYEVPPFDRGLLWYESDDLAAVIRDCDRGRVPGRRSRARVSGIRTTLSAYNAVIDRGNPLRHRIEHGGCFTPERALDRREAQGPRRQPASVPVRPR
jgi:predicted amidohydrolase YtcJ